MEIVLTHQIKKFHVLLAKHNGTHTQKYANKMSNFKLFDMEIAFEKKECF